MAYTGGIPSGPLPYNASPSINSKVAAFQSYEDEEKLRQFHAALMAQQQGQGVMGQALPTRPGVTPHGYDAQGTPLTPNFSGHQQYVQNAGVNALLNRVIKPGAGGGAGAAGAAGGGGGFMDSLAKGKEIAGGGLAKVGGIKKLLGRL
jgi:hypothetical protein